MRLVPLVLALLPAAAAPAPAPAPAPGFTWQADLATSLETAAAEGRVVFVALDHQDEGRCEAFLDLVDDKAVVAAAEGALCLPASPQTHGKRDTCKRFGDMTCADHQRTEADLFAGTLAANESGVTAVPQYLWLDGAGEVLLSVPYELDRAGLLWCFETARRLVDPEGAPPRHEASRPPRRLLMGSVYRTFDGDALGRGMTPDELEVAMDGTKSNILGLVPIGDILEVVFTDHPDAVDYAVKNLGFVLESFARGRVPASVHTVGVIAPARFWEVAELFAEDEQPEVRHEAAVALEQLGAKDALKLARKGWKDEDESDLRGAWLRAVAASGAADKKTRKLVLDVALDEDEPRDLRAAAAFAAGYLERHEDVREVWTALLAGDDGTLRQAAACGVALARDEALLEALEAALVRAGGSLEAAPDEGGDAPAPGGDADSDSDTDSDTDGFAPGALDTGTGEREATDDAVLARARAVLLGADLVELQADVERLTRDGVDRERVFFRSIGRAPSGGDFGGGRGGFGGR